MNHIYVGLLLLLGFVAQTSYAMTLSEYLEQVKKNNTGYSASVQSNEGILKRADDAKVMLSPVMFASVQNSIDKNPSRNAALQGEQTTAQNATVGVSQNTSIGLNAKVSYSLTSADIKGASPLYLPESKFYDSKPYAELSYSLWRNAAGSEIREQLGLARNQAEAQALGEKFKGRMTLLEAELAFWRLALAQKTINLQKETLERARKIREWNNRRVESQLADKSDLLQADAIVKFRELELITAQNEEEAAARAMNQLRGSTEDKVTDKLDVPVQKDVDAIKVEPFAAREDVQAASKQTQIARSLANVNIEKTKPTFEVFANLSLDGHKSDLSGSIGQSGAIEYPSNTVGLRLSMPINPGLIDSNNQGYNQEILASELNLQKKQFDSERDYRDLTLKLDDALKRWKLARTIEDLQKNKYEYEKSKLNRGRSITYQVLTFEQDLTSAQTTTLRVEFEILRIMAQLKTYAGDQAL